MVNFKACCVAIVSLTLTTLPLVAATPTARSTQAPYNRHDNRAVGSYIVKLKNGHSLEDHFKAIGQRFAVHEFNSDFLPGYYADDVSDDLREKVRGDPGVSSVDDDYFGDPIDDDEDVECPKPSNPLDLLGMVVGGLAGGVAGLGASQTDPSTSGVQKNPSWALSYLSSAQKNPTSMDYEYMDNAGEGVDVYVIDSGIGHVDTEFGNRVTDEYNDSDEGFGDAAGHGTKVASMVGGSIHGVAKSANLRAVKARAGGKPKAARIIASLDAIVATHNTRKSQPGFKGSIINMSFGLSRTDELENALNKVHDAGISMVASAGNKGYKPNHYPSGNSHVIAVGAVNQKYNPRTRTNAGSNYGKDIVDIWAPGDQVAGTLPGGQAKCGSGTSFSSAYVTGILAIFYGAEGAAMSPDLARQRLFDNADDFVDLPTGTDWKESPLTLANTGFLKGQAQDPKVPYIGSPNKSPPNPTPSPPPSPPPSTSQSPSSGCLSPDHSTPRTSFKLAQSDKAVSLWTKYNCLVEFSPDGLQSCTLNFNPCSKKYKERAVSVALTVTLLSQDKGSLTPTFEDGRDTFHSIVSDCDTTTVDAKWGGWKTITTGDAKWMYNVTADQTGSYGETSQKHKSAQVTSGPYCDKDWISG